MGPVTLLKNFTYVGDPAQSWNTDWVSWPAEFQNAQIVVLTKSRIGTSILSIQLQTTWDTDQASNVGTVINTGAPATQQQDINTGMGPMIRLNLLSAAACQVVVSVFVTPKST
jgi:hypothetical protein